MMFDKLLGIDKRIFEDGYRAYCSNHLRWENPYDVEFASKGSVWDQGWTEAERQKETIRCIKFPEQNQ